MGNNEAGLTEGWFGRRDGVTKDSKLPLNI
jgi:hypothetical protein